jgi:hypothetical protein
VGIVIQLGEIELGGKINSEVGILIFFLKREE